MTRRRRNAPIRLCEEPAGPSCLCQEPAGDEPTSGGQVLIFDGAGGCRQRRRARGCRGPSPEWSRKDRIRQSLRGARWPLLSLRGARRRRSNLGRGSCLRWCRRVHIGAATATVLPPGRTHMTKGPPYPAEDRKARPPVAHGGPISFIGCERRRLEGFIGGMTAPPMAREPRVPPLCLCEAAAAAAATSGTTPPCGLMPSESGGQPSRPRPAIASSPEGSSQRQVGQPRALALNPDRWGCLCEAAAAAAATPGARPQPRQVTLSLRGRHSGRGNPGRPPSTLTSATSSLRGAGPGLLRRLRAPRKDRWN